MCRDIPRPRLSRTSSPRGVCQGKQKARAQYGSLVRRGLQRPLLVTLYIETLTIVIRLVLQSPSTWNPTTRNWSGERC